MSTKLSTDLNITRSSTRRMAPPGGISNVVFGDQYSKSESAPPTRQTTTSTVDNAQAQSSEQQATEVQAPTPQLDLKIGLVIATDYLAKSLQAATLSELSKSGVSGCSVVHVPSALELVHASQLLISRTRFDVIVALGAVINDHFSASSEATAVLSGLTSLGLTSNTPIIQGIVFSDSVREAKLLVPEKSSSFSTAAIHLGQLKRGSPIQNNNNTAAWTSNDDDGVSVMASPAVNGGKQQVLDVPVPQATQILLDKLRKSLFSHGARGIVSLGRKFRIIDDDGSGDLNQTEFSKAIREHALNWSDEEIRSLFDWFDEDGSGSVNYDEFLVGVRGELNDRRKQLVLMAFQILDTDSSGTIDIDDIADKYDCTKHPDVLAGRKTAQAVLREFLGVMEGRDKDGKVTPAEFERYYANISASVDDDDYFELMMRNAWHISGGEGQCANSTCKRVLVTHPDGHQTVEEVKNDLGVTDYKGALGRQGIQASNVETYGGVDTTKGGAGVQTPPRRTVAKKPPGGGSSLVLG